MRITCTALALAIGGQAAGDVIYSQDVAGDDVPIDFGYFSHYEPRSNHNYLHSDDFVLERGATIESVVWWGIGEGLIYDGIDNVANFRVAFYEADETDPDNPLPGTLIAEELHTKDQTSPTPTGRVDADDTIEYRHEVALSTPVDLAPGKYFLSIGADSVNTRYDAWQWRDSVPANGYASIYWYSLAIWRPEHHTDSAFELHGVPAPGGLALTATVTAVGAPRRRR